MAEKKRIALAGFGVVGQGVYERLAAEPRRFEVAAILCRDPDRHAGAGGPRALLTKDAARLAGCDMLIEAIGGIAPAEAVVSRALAAGVDVVSANKTLVSRRFHALRALQEKSGARLLYSAAVGGGVPMLETVRAKAAEGPIARIEAVVNGTTNFVLDRVGAGASLAQAISEAQAAGFAEADPADDIDGVDAAEKLSLIVRAAFGVEIDPDDIAADRLGAVRVADIADAHRAGAPFKQVASARRQGASIEAHVRLVRTQGALARPRRAENCLVMASANGAETILHGKGAGRDPTAASVLSDVEALLGEPDRSSRNSKGRFSETASRAGSEFPLVD